MQFFKTTDTNTHICFFSGLTVEQIQSLHLEEIDKTFKKGEIIFQENAYPNALFVVYKGIVKLHRYGENGKEQITRLAKAGDLVGYRSLICEDRYQANCSAVEETRLFKIPKDTFFNLLKENSDFSFKITRLLADELKESEQKLMAMAQKSVREKIAETLLLLNDKFGVDARTQALKPCFTRKEISDIAGVTTESCIRTISDFNKEKLIALEGRKIIMSNVNKLRLEIQV